MATARQLMTSPAESVDHTDTLVTAAQALKAADVGSMPVKGKDGRLDCVVTDRDIVVRGLAEGLDPATTQVGDIGTDSVVTVMADDDADTVAAVLAKYQIRRVPVVDADELVGMISQADLARHLSNKQTGDVVESISR